MSDPHDPGPPGPPGPPGEPGDPEVGSVGEGVAKLLGALSDWAQDSGGDLGTGLGATLTGLAGHAAARLADVNDHLATGAAECTYCPICRTVHVIRETSPEVKAHLATAASSLLQAVAGLLATVPPPGSAQTRATAAGADFERIDLDDLEDPDHDHRDDD
ncbi:hypothetical protein [Nocardioides rubriscoriae]|uniref:hypothetical protein n=1 Tax=Nocardioides rubriscoriae TaxID=642762 RepID=UPI0011E02DA2|nr:hypothetical protein [Nocardioides rubriscoriae]